MLLHPLAMRDASLRPSGIYDEQNQSQDTLFHSICNSILRTTDDMFLRGDASGFFYIDRLDV